MEQIPRCRALGRHLRGPLAARGATLVEYALVLSLLVVTALGAIEFLGDRSSGEVNNQAECVSMRPPPPGCQIPAATTTTTLVPPSVTVTTVPEPEPASPTVSLNGQATAQDGPPRSIALPLRVTVDNPIDFGGEQQPVPGAIIRGEAFLGEPGNQSAYLSEVFFVNCVTGVDGACPLTFTIPYEDVSHIHMRVTGVDGPTPAVIGIDTFVEHSWD